MLEKSLYSILHFLWSLTVGKVCRVFWPELVEAAARDIHPTEASIRLHRSPILVLFVYFIFAVEWVLWAHSATK